MFEEIRSVRRVHVGDDAARDAEGRFVAGRDIEKHTGALGVADQLALPVLFEIVLRTEAGRAFYTV